MVLVDEAGFSLTPLIPNTWAVKGTTPKIACNLNWKKFSAIGGIAPSGKLQGTRRLYKEVIQYLGQLLKHIDGHIVVLWDGLPQHR